MPSLHSPLASFSRSAGAFLLLAIFASNASASGADPTLLDDFSDPAHSSVGAQRLIIDDSVMGSQSIATQTVAEGIVAVKGQLIPGRGVPAFISFVLLTAPDAQSRDLSAYQGLRLRIKVHAGALSIQAASTEVTNHDYHVSPIATQGPDFQEVRLPFKDMKPAWSAPSPLNLKTITSVNLVAFAMAKSEFSYEVDEIGFY